MVRQAHHKKCVKKVQKIAKKLQKRAKMIAFCTKIDKKERF